MPSFKDKVTARVDDLRERYGWFDHVVRTVQHYGESAGNLQAGAVTYFGFLSFFPILALAFAVVGVVATVYPDADKALVDAIEKVLPEMVSAEPEPGKIAISQIQDAAPAIFSFGLLAVLYSGLGWLSAMRTALLAVFEKPQQEKPNFVVGKLRDLLSLALIGLTLVVSVAVSGVVSGLSKQILEFLGLGVALSPLLKLLTVVIGLGANMLLFYALFRLLADPDTPKRSLWSGALLGSVGFEVLKRLSSYVIASTKDQPAFQAFGIALVLVVWIYYFSRVVVYAACWAHTSAEARALREQDDALASAVAGPRTDLDALQAARDAHPAGKRGRPFATGAATGAAATLGLVAAVRNRHR